MSTEKQTKPQTSSTRKERFRVVAIDGGKGGVGKSIVSKAILSYCLQNKTEVALIDADTQNPDVSRMYDTHLSILRADVSIDDGIMDALDFVASHLNKVIVINLPAGIGKHMPGLMKELVDFAESQDMEAEFSLLWTINTGPDSVNLLNDAINHYGSYFKKTAVIANLFFAVGDQAKNNSFALWSNSKIASGYTTYYFPALHHRVTTIFDDPKNSSPYYAELDPLATKVTLTQSERFKLQIWLRENAKIFEQVIK